MLFAFYSTCHSYFRIPYFVCIFTYYDGLYFVDAEEQRVLCYLVVVLVMFGSEYNTQKCIFVYILYNQGSAEAVAVVNILVK